MAAPSRLYPASPRASLRAFGRGPQELHEKKEEKLREKREEDLRKKREVYLFKNLFGFAMNPLLEEAREVQAHFASDDSLLGSLFRQFPPGRGGKG